MTPEDRTKLLLAEIQNALNKGTQHFRMSDNKLLETPQEILETLVNEKKVEIVPASHRN